MYLETQHLLVLYTDITLQSCKANNLPAKESSMEFGTFWKKLVRRKDPHTSQEAAKSVDTTNMEQIVYEVISQYPSGCIQDEVLAHLMSYPYSTVTARFRALLDKGYIIDTGLTRPGKSGRKQRVLIIKEFHNA